MAIPSTGTDWETGGFNNIDAKFFLRGGRQAVLLRQARGALTDMSPGVWSPFALDGTLRNDLFCEVQTTGGFWVTNTTPNEGFRLLGAFKEGAGPSEEEKVDKDDYMVEQSNRPYDTDIIKESKMIKVTPVETLRPFIKRVRHSLPLVDVNGLNLVEDPGQSNAFWGSPVDTNFIEYQLLKIQARRKQGKTIYVANGYPLCKVVDKGNSKMDKKESDAQEFTFEPLPDGIMLDLNGKPIADGEWVAGDGWTALGGVPILSATPPVATPGATGKATVALADPTGTGDPWTYTVDKATTPFTSWTAASPDGATFATAGVVVSSGGTTTIKVASVTAGSTKFRVNVTGTNGATTVSAPSNAATIT